MSADVAPSLVSWLTAVVGMRLQGLLEQMPVTPEQILPYVRRLGDPPPQQVGAPPGHGHAPFNHAPFNHAPSPEPRPISLSPAPLC